MSAEPSRPGEGINWAVGTPVIMVTRKRDYAAERATEGFERIYADEPVPTTITYVGRKWAKVEASNTTGDRFNIRTGLSEGGYPQRQLWVSVDALTRSAGRQHLVNAIEQWVRRINNGLDGLDLDQVEALHRILVEGGLIEEPS